MLRVIVGPWWPFIVLAIVLVALLGLASIFPSWRERRWKALEIIAALVTAAAAVSIPLVLDRDNRNTRTLELLNDVSRKITEAAAKKEELDGKNQVRAPEKFSYDYIRNHADVMAAVFTILNEYEYVCLGGNQRLFSNPVIKSLRWSALHQTWQDYGTYIAERRGEGGDHAKAWIECDKWLQQNPAPE
jgi:hypothetical protein